MFKAGDSVVVVRPESKTRPPTVHEQAADKSIGSFITEKPVMVEHKATVGQLGRIFIPVLSDGSILLKPYLDLVFGKNDKVSWKAKKADHIQVVDHKDTFVKGKEYIARGVIAPSFESHNIPVILNGESVMIPLNQLVFKEKK